MKRFYLFLLMIFISTVATSQVTEAEFQALKALYNSTGGPNWTTQDGWENINTTATKDDVTSNWHGLTIEGSHVTTVNLYNNNLVGYLPAQIGAFKWLTYLYLDDNKLEGSLPVVMGTMTELIGLSLSSNLFSGSWPESLKQLKKLQVMNPYRNPFNCPFPNEIIRHWESLTTLQLYDCGFTGELEDIFMDIPKLFYFDISRNKMSGTIPPSINTLNLISCHLGQNNFTGTLPSLEGSANLSYFTTNSNEFSGSIPATYGNFPNLQYLHLEQNKLSGKIPEGIFGKALKRLWIYYNFFTFEGIEPVYDKIKKLPQYDIGTSRTYPLNQPQLSFNEGEELVLNAKTLSVYELGGNNNRYTWYRNGAEVYNSNNPSYTVAQASAANSGVYYFKVTNTVVTDLTLQSEPVIVSVLVEGNNVPTDITLSNTHINENSTGDVGTLKATDSDADDTHIFMLVKGDGVNDRDNYRFTINGNVLRISSSANYEVQKQLNVNILASDLKGGIFTKGLVIDVIDVDEAPVFGNQITSVIIDETAPNNSVAVYLVAVDPEGQPVSYSIKSGNEDDAFAIYEDKIIVKDNSKLNYDIRNQYILKIAASDGNKESTIDIRITLSKINKMPLVEDAVFTIPENSKAGTVVGSITATDPEGDALSYTIISGNHDDAFTLSGNKLLVNNVQAIDYELHPRFTLIIDVSDDISHVPASVTVNLTNLADETGNDIVTFSVPGMVAPVQIDKSTRSVRVKVEDVNPASLHADFTLSKGAVSQPVSGSMVDLSQPLQIRVTSEVGVGADWTVYLSIPSPASFSLSPSLVVYPNPAEDEIHVSGIPPSSVVSLGDATGRILLTISNPGPSEVISLRSCRPGLCFLIVDSSEGRSVSKIIRK